MGKLEIDDKTKAMVKSVLEWVYCIVIAVVLALLVRYFLGTPTIVKQPSMFPTLKEDQRLILNRLDRTLNKEPERGDIVTFEAPTESYIPPTKEGTRNVKATYKSQEDMNLFQKFLYNVLELDKTSYIKRVIGLPGEVIKIQDGYVYINGEKLEEKYLQAGIITDITEGGLPAEVTVPEGYVFVMGDNRSKSTDSRRFGCIPINKIEGKVILRFWPLDVFGKVE